MDTKNINNSRRDFLKTLSIATTATLLTNPSSLLALTPVSKIKTLSTSLRLPTNSNCEITAIGRSKVEVRFPYDKGYLTAGRNAFRDEDDLTNYLLEAFLMERDEKGGMRGSVRCISAYQRIDSNGKSIFTFDDPILDLITDENGIFTISGTRVNAKDIILANERESTSINKSALVDGKLTKNLVSKASFTASQSIPSEVFFPSSGASRRIRFKAYRDVFPGSWRAGANIKTRRLDFVSASITGHYALDTFSCAEVKVDTDSDTTDNFLNEFEFGVNSPPASGVLSECRALWDGNNLSETLAKGCIVS